jgi:cytochrome c oxidase subunit III
MRSRRLSHNSDTVVVEHAHQFTDMEQQREVGTLGMWTFLITEVLFFGGLFCAYIVYRTQYPDVFIEASQELNVILGGINTLVLLSSSLTVALAVHAVQEGKKPKVILGYLWFTLLCGFVFLVIKGFEYAEKIHHHLVPGKNFHFDGSVGDQAQIYFSLYFMMTGIHALHMIIGIGLLIVLMWRVKHRHFTPEYYAPVEIFGLYWHFVDIVWIFLYPLLYLIHVHA